MRHIQRIFSELGLLVAVHAITYFRERDPLFLMFGMAGNVLLGAEIFSGFEETRLKKTADRMPVIRALVATQAIFIARFDDRKALCAFVSQAHSEDWR